MTTPQRQRQSRRFSFLSFSSLALDDPAAAAATHDTQIFPRLKAGLSAARRRVLSGSGTGGGGSGTRRSAQGPSTVSVAERVGGDANGNSNGNGNGNGGGGTGRDDSGGNAASVPTPNASTPTHNTPSRSAPTSAGPTSNPSNLRPGPSHNTNSSAIAVTADLKHPHPVPLAHTHGRVSFDVAAPERQERRASLDTPRRPRSGPGYRPTRAVTAPVPGVLGAGDAHGGAPASTVAVAAPDGTPTAPGGPPTTTGTHDQQAPHDARRPVSNPPGAYRPPSNQTSTQTHGLNQAPSQSTSLAAPASQGGTRTSGASRASRSSVATEAEFAAWIAEQRALAVRRWDRPALPQFVNTLNTTDRGAGAGAGFDFAALARFSAAEQMPRACRPSGIIVENGVLVRKGRCATRDAHECSYDAEVEKFVADIGARQRQEAEAEAAGGSGSRSASEGKEIAERTGEKGQVTPPTSASTAMPSAPRPPKAFFGPKADVPSTQRWTFAAFARPAMADKSGLGDGGRDARNVQRFAERFLGECDDKKPKCTRNACHLHQTSHGLEIHHATHGDALRLHHAVSECWRLHEMVLDDDAGVQKAGTRIEGWKGQEGSVEGSIKQSGENDTSGKDVEKHEDEDVEAHQADAPDNRRSWQEDLAHGVIEYWQGVAADAASAKDDAYEDAADNGVDHNEYIASDCGPKKTDADGAVERWMAAVKGVGDDYPVAACPDNHPTCHLHRSSAGIELHHAQVDHAAYERERRQKKPRAGATCWSRNRVVLDRTHKSKAARVQKAWRDTWGTKPKWVEGTTFSDLYAGKVDAFGVVNEDGDKAQNSEDDELGNTFANTTFTSGNLYPHTSKTSQRRTHSVDDRQARRRSGAPPPLDAVAESPVRAKKSATPPSKAPPFPQSMIDAAELVSLSAFVSDERSDWEKGKERAASSAYQHPSDRVKSKRFSAPPDPVTDPTPIMAKDHWATLAKYADEANGNGKGADRTAASDRPPTPHPAAGDSQSTPSDPQGSIKRYLDLDASELAHAVARAEDLIASAGKSPHKQQGNESHLLDNISSAGSGSSSPWVDDVIHAQNANFLSSHVVLSTPEDGDAELTLSLRGQKYVLPAMSVSGFRVTTEAAYWEMIRGARLVDIIGDVRNLVAVAKRLTGVDTIRLVLRGHAVPWSLHIRAENLITFTHVPWSPTKRKVDADPDAYFRESESRCTVQVGPVPNGIRRFVLHVVYDDRAPGMAAARLARLVPPASLRTVVLILQRERASVLSTALTSLKSQAGPKWLRTPLAHNLAHAICEIVEKTKSSVTLVGLEMLSGLDGGETLQKLGALAGLPGTAYDECAPGRVRCVSHAEYAAEVGVQVYALETNVVAWPRA